MAGPAPRGPAAPHPPQTGALPPVRVRLPDGEVSARLVRRWQTTDGRWIYRVALRAWSSRTASTGQDLSEDMIEIDVPSDRVGPVPGTSYDAVPKLRRQPPAPAPGRHAPPAPPPAPPHTDGWLCERVRTIGVDRGLVIRIHRSDCWLIDSPTGATLTTEEARTMAATDPAATLCDACDTQPLAPKP
ncbi:DUF6233 domain-containing protein [Streptomyces sp. NPDC051546]|uniref:DUF6233 domain-containing protein n=1 Tax=Streptomyces sp. NPDC051546 TaxID=3365655 RepID=UPI0037AD07FB